MQYHIKQIFSLFLLGIMTASCANGQKEQSGKSSKKYNIVVFIGDDLGINDIGPYGNKIVRTPSLDQFTGESLLFANTFAGSPTCGPSRSTIFTGLMPFRHGAHGNHSGVRDTVKSIAHYLKPLGYTVAIAGKLHVGPGQVFPFEHVSKTNVPEPGFEKRAGLNYDLQMGPVEQWLSDRKKDEPFMLVVADHSPHVVWPEKAEYGPDEVDIPPQHIDTKDTRNSRARYYTDITKMDTNLGRLLKSLDENGLSENTIVVFTADQGPQWPFAKWTLYDYGINTPMIIRWPGQIKPGSRTDAMVSQADIVPTLVEIAGGKAPEQIDGQSFLPLLKGENKLHREVIFATHTGDKLMNRSPARMVRTKKYKYILNLVPQIPYHTHMDKATDHDGGREYWDSWREKARTDPGAAAVLERYHHHPAEELYDVEQDPNELKNLANDPKYTQMLKDFRTQLAVWRKQQGDFETGPEKISEKPAKAKGGKPVAPYVFLD